MGAPQARRLSRRSRQLSLWHMRPGGRGGLRRPGSALLIYTAYTYETGTWKSSPPTSTYVLYCLQGLGPALRAFGYEWGFQHGSLLAYEIELERERARRSHCSCHEQAGLRRGYSG